MFNVDRELQDGLLGFLPELQQRLGAVGLIVVTGDVAYSGKAREYETAEGFLRDVRSRLRDHTMPVRVIPGNHDVLREATNSPDQDHLRSGPRVAGLDADARGTMLSHMLQDGTQGPALLKPLETYNSFAAGFGCAVSHGQPYWEHRASLGDGWILRLRGMNSVLLSNHNDGRDGMVVGGNLQTNAWMKTAGEINVSLCHHPYCWLLDAEELTKRVWNRSHLHITGHVHRHDIDDSKPGHVHLMAGALQPPRKEKAISRFNGLAFEVVGPADKQQLKLVVVAVRWDADEDRFVFDEPECKECVLDLVPLPTACASLPPDDPDFDRLRERLTDLPGGQQLDAASKIGLSVGVVLSLTTPEMVDVIMEHARTSSQLTKLWDEVTELHGGQSGQTNPFKGRGL